MHLNGTFTAPEAGSYSFTVSGTIHDEYFEANLVAGSNTYLIEGQSYIDRHKTNTRVFVADLQARETVYLEAVDGRTVYLADSARQLVFIGEKI